MRKLFIVLSLGIALQSFGATAPIGKSSGERIPVVINIDPKYLSSLPPEKQKLLQEVQDMVKNNLSYWDSFKVDFPSTAFDEKSQGKIVQLSSLFQSPTSAEVATLPYDEKGNHKKISSEQLKSIKEEGMFVIPSKQYPGQFHVWKITTLLQKGSKNIQISYEDDMGSALGHILITIPEALYDEEGFSVKHGFEKIGQGLRGLLSNVVGLIETKAKYSQSEVNTLIEAKKKAYIVEKGKVENLKLAPERKLDLRLYDPQLTKQLQSDMYRINNTFENNWRTNEASLRRSIRAELVATNSKMKDESREAVLLKKLKKIHFEALQKAYREDKELNDKQVGYGQLVANHLVAVDVAEEMEKKLTRIINAQEEAIREHLKRDNPKLAMSKEWLEKETKKKTQEFYREIRWQNFLLVPFILREMKLDQEAFIFEKMIEFQKDSEDRIRKDLNNETEAAEDIQFEKRIWSSDNWLVKAVKDSRGNISFYPQKYVSSHVRTDHSFWRLGIAKEETEANFKNGLYKILVTNLWNGPLGIKSLVLKDPFYADETVNQQTGVVEDDKSSKTGTLRSRVSDVWAGVKAARDAFEAKPDTGFLGKKYTRWLNQFWNYGVKGALGTAAVVVSQPIATVCNTAVSCSLAATAPVWAPLSSMFKLGVSTVLYDMYAPVDAASPSHPIHRWFPAASYCVADICAGVGQVALSGLNATVAQPAAFAAKGLYALTRKEVRTAYDAIMAKLLISKGRLPATDTFVAKRISGPGMTSNYFFQISPEISLLALQSALEGEELTRFNQAEKVEIQKPVTEYYKFFSELLVSIASVNPTGTDATNAVIAGSEKPMKELSAKMQERGAFLSRISQLPIERSLIRQNQKNLDKTLELGHQLVESFYKEHIAVRMNKEEVGEFWDQKELSPEDFVGLTKYFFAKIFSTEYLTPLEVADGSFVIEVQNEDLKNFFVKLFSRTGPGSAGENKTSIAI